MEVFYHRLSSRAQSCRLSYDPYFDMDIFVDDQ